MTELLTAAQMRAVERRAIESGAVTGLELMERAGQGVVDAVFAQWPAFAGRPDAAQRAVVLCGPGNNGGDGFVVARLLQGAGWAVDVFLHGSAKQLPPDARTNYERWQRLGPVRPLSEGEHVGAAALCVDALFGTGLSRPLDMVLPDAAGALRVAVDVPSGLCADSGRVLGQGDGVCMQADLTVSFHRAKRGHMLGAGPAMCGQLVVSDIGLTEPAGADVCHLVTAQGLAGHLMKGGGHKYDYGHALILSGGVGKGGAARMAARGALRIGAGAVTVGCPPAALIENAAQLDAVMLRRVPGADALNAVLTDKRINALCLGPGLGTGAREADLVRAALMAGRGLVLDADALTLLSQDGDLFALIHDTCVLTPHGGEFARLFPDIAEKLDAPALTGPAYSKVDAVRAAAQRAGCTVLFKGPDTVIADPSGACRVNAAVYGRSAPWLATAGAGDVLAGFITGLMARGFAPMHAAEVGAWLHVACARAFGPGLIAEDLPEALPGVLRELRK
ncbi:NAD(P)H-hydrate dehydratase [Loktanella salsilacus]|uniref:NAD(P)H-hydrate dehydratase n=1 Tax=Loktanella salsilacus TaxID=195913 RepID=UPI0037351CFE